MWSNLVPISPAGEQVFRNLLPVVIPFVTITPVGEESLLKASKDQRYKFCEDFLLVKSWTNMMPLTEL
uniref:Uncharacterized protein n=1 Tax=Anguilla anguilla TaxID=7936 RepID=A0A0E9T173_ANGAN